MEYARDEIEEGKGFSRYSSLQYVETVFEDSIINPFEAETDFISYIQVYQPTSRIVLKPYFTI